MRFTAIMFALIMTLGVQAQWTNDTNVNTLVVDSEGGDMKSVGASDGKTYVVFWKVVAPPTNYELRFQVLDVDGTQLLGNDGVLVSNTIPMSTYTSIWSLTIDSNDDIYIGVTGTGGGEPAIAFKLDEMGNHIWNSDGVIVGSGYTLTILPLSSGETVVSWFPGGESLMQKLDANGATVWGSPKPVSNNGPETVPASFFEISNGEFILVFHSLTGGIYSNLYAQRFNTDGDAQWTDPTQLSNRGTQFNIPYYGLNIGNTVYYGFKSSFNNRFDSHLQRIDSDGSLPWGINGVDFDINETYFEMDTRIAHEEGSQFIWAICTYTTPSQSLEGEYVQKFDKDTGARLFTNNAKEVYPVDSDYNVHAGALRLVDDTPLFLLKSGFDNGGTPTTLGVVKLDENGDFVWPEESVAMATYSANKSRIHFTEYVNDQSVAVFIEDKGSGPRIYAQNFFDGILGTGGQSNTSKQVVYTNPVLNELKINSVSGVTSIMIQNLLGHHIFGQDYHLVKDLTINTQNWDNGIYFMTIQTEKGIIQGIKLVK
jgi:hypothetical protein